MAEITRNRFVLKFIILSNIPLFFHSVPEAVHRHRHRRLQVFIGESGDQHFIFGISLPPFSSEKREHTSRNAEYWNVSSFQIWQDGETGWKSSTPLPSRRSRGNRTAYLSTPITHATSTLSIPFLFSILFFCLYKITCLYLQISWLHQLSTYQISLFGNSPYLYVHLYILILLLRPFLPR